MPPFADDGVYTPPDGATDAFAGELIRSATWNAIFTDISIALTQLGQGNDVLAPRVITLAGTVTVTDTDLLIVMNLGSPSATTFDLPAVSARNGASLYIFDYPGNAGPMTFTPTGSDTIMGEASWTVTGVGTGLGGSILLIPVQGVGWLAR